MPSINYSAATNKGYHRGNNEDCFLSIPEQGLWLVADGMGGHEAGEVASAIVAETVKKSTIDGQMLEDSIQLAHQSVLSAAHEGRGAAGMGSTVVALQTRDQDYQVAWVGDSRAYLWTPATPDNRDTGAGSGTLERLSTDHSYVQMLVETGAIQEHEAANHPDKNVITQCIGSQDVEQVKVGLVRGQWTGQQWILLCSDGLTDELSDEIIAETLCHSHSVREAVNRLVKQALDHGGHDNVTVQIVESPLASRSALSIVKEWLPDLTGHRLWDGSIYLAALASLLLLVYWLL